MSQPVCHISLLPESTLTQIFRCLLKPVNKYFFRCDIEDEEEDVDDYGKSEPKEVRSTTNTGGRQLWLERWAYDDRRDKRKYLVPVSRVCRLWNSIANDILYTEIYVAG